MTEQQKKDEFELSRTHMLEYDLKGRGIKNPRLPEIVEFSTAAAAELPIDPADGQEPADAGTQEFQQD